jgi:hypothetical protein
MVRERDQRRTIDMLSTALMERDAKDALDARAAAQARSELEEAMRMGGAGPWRAPVQQSSGVQARESTLPYIAQGAYGDAKLMLQNVEWKRETSLSLLEFTRWGIQQIILIARLRCIKDPMLNRGMNVSAQYVFGRGVEITSEDEAAAQILRDWRARNKSTLGHIALAETHRAKYYDGNIFWMCFTDRTNTGEVNVRTVDAVEIMDIMTNPEDTSEPWYYKREWVQTEFADDGSRRNVTRRMWYPALNYEPSTGERFDSIEGVEVNWDAPIYHRKCNAPGKWHFGLPGVYPALGFASAVKRFLEDCMTIRNALAQFSMLLTTKGGQQAMQGAKTQLSTTVGPNASLWDQNPPAIAGSIFASGPGTELKAFSTKGAGGDPSEVREYKLMVCMVFGLPESFFADMNTSNLATATSLDRPTELNFMEMQEVWREDLVVLATYQLRAALGAASGRLREAIGSRRVQIRERARVQNSKGRMVYEAAAKDDEITVMVNFPSIIEADVPANIASIVNAATFGNKAGEFKGIDEKEAVRLCNQELGISEDVLSEQYPDSGPDAYDPTRKKAPEPAVNPATGLPEAPAVKQSEAVRNALTRVSRALRTWEADPKLSLEEALTAEEMELREGWVTINGAHVLIGEDGTIEKGPAAIVGKHKSELYQSVSKAERAKLAHQGGKHADQKIAEETEHELAVGLGLTKSGNNRPFDLYSRSVGVEIKTKTSGANDEISIKSSAVANKKRYVEEHGLKRTYLVIVDKRPSGTGSSTGKTRYFVREGFGGGTNRIKSMTEVSDMAALKKFMKLRG